MSKVTPSQFSLAAATSTVVVTGENTSSTTYTDLTTTTDACTVTIGVNGVALVSIAATLFSAQVFCSFAISGATTRAATDNMSIVAASTTGLGAVFLVTGLTPGSTTFKMKYRVSSGTGGASARTIAVVPL